MLAPHDVGLVDYRDVEVAGYRLAPRAVVPGDDSGPIRDG
jgi:hypothetical protein